jgi:prepilin-type N-terminal cleavage/methylation domain-containing protein
MLPASRRSAFTLLELLVVIAISGILFAAMASFARTSLTTIEVLQEDNVASQTARTALSRISRESELAHTIQEASAHTLRFVCTDVTGDGADDLIEYAWNAGSRELTRTLNGDAQIFADNVSLLQFDYEYETEQEVTIAAPGDELPMTLIAFSGVGDGDDRDVSEHTIYFGSYSMYVQEFVNRVEVPRATSLTLRLRRQFSLLPGTLRFYLYRSPQTVAYGELRYADMPGSQADVTIPLEWVAPDGVAMEVDQKYELYIVWNELLATGPAMPYQRVDDGPELPDGLQLRSSSGGFNVDGSLYLSIRGPLPIDLPQRSTTTKSVLKKITATMTATDDGSIARMSRTWTVVNR